MSYKSLNSLKSNDVFQFSSAGDSLEGTVMGFREITTKNGPATIVDIQPLDGGEEVSIFLTAGLRSKMNDGLVGERVLIEYQGEMKNKNTGRMFKSFEVSVWSEETDEERPF